MLLRLGPLLQKWLIGPADSYRCLTLLKRMSADDREDLNVF